MSGEHQRPSVSYPYANADCGPSSGEPVAIHEPTSKLELHLGMALLESRRRTEPVESEVE
jgi:hypothetical protein